MSVVLAGRYELRGVLGRGGMADVHEGWDRRLGRPVAVKVLRAELASVPGTRRRFESEARLAATLNHPNVVAVHDSGEDAGVPYIVMERLPGRSLADDISAGPLPGPRVRAILAQILAALGAAHALGIVHRDIKPGNVLFDAAGTVKVTDFGIAKSADTDHTTTGLVLGTVAYLGPDRIAGNPATVADDLYAVGVVGYEALSGRRPFTGETIASLVHAIMSGQYPPLATLRPDVDPGLLAVIDRAMTRDPHRRFPDAHAMATALQAPHPTAPPPTRAFTPAAPAPAALPAPVRRSRRMGVIAAVAALLVAVALVALVVSIRDDGSTVGPASVSPTPPPVTSTVVAPVGPPVTNVPPQTESAPGNGNHGNHNGNGGTGKSNEKGNKSGN
ncbi:serine/threonine-protein kinase [Rhodococcus sp. NPDC003348]